MAKIGDAIWELGVRDFMLTSQPTNEKEFLEYFKKITGKTEDDMAITSSDPKLFGCTWKEVKEKFDELEAAAPLNDLRHKRNIMLTECDWTRVDDNGLSEEKKKEWETYRKALRDLPSSDNGKNAAYENDGVTLKNVTWPKRPE